MERPASVRASPCRLHFFRGLAEKYVAATPVTDVTGVAAPRLDGNSLVLRPRCLKIRGIATPACALVRNDRAFSNSPLTPFAARRTARRGSFFSYYCRLVMLSLDFHFFFHILFKTCEKESLYHQSIAFLCACFTRQSKKLHRTFTVCGVFPVYSFPQAISTPFFGI